MTLVDAVPTPYDFRRPNKFNRDHVRALQIVGETFARQFTTVLSTSLRAVSQVQLVNVGQLTYDEYVRETPNPTFLGVLALDPLVGTSLLHIPLPVVMAMVDRFLGGTAEGEMPERPLTEIETGLVRSLLDRVLRELTYAFEPLTPVRPRVLQFESNPVFAQITSATDMVVTLDFDLRVGAHTGQANLCVPFASLQPVLDEVSTAAMQPTRGMIDPVAVRAAMEAALEPATLDVRVRFRPTRLASAEIVGLRPGDIVPLPHRVDRPLIVSVGGIDRFVARAGQRGRRLACLIVDGAELDDAPDPLSTPFPATHLPTQESAR